jgi:hypothetical protein
MGMMEQLKNYISYIVGILGFAGIIWTYASKSAGKDFDVSSLKSKVESIENKMVVKSDLKVLTDSIGLYNNRMEGKINEVIKGQNALRTSYANYLKRDKTLTLDDFTKFMNGIQWVVSPIEDKRNDSIDFQIKIRKKQ